MINLETKQRDVLYCGVDRDKIRNAHPALDTKVLVELRTFIEERYTIHVRKDIKGHCPPWTSDPILMNYKFTNVFREDDRVSRNLIQLVSKNTSLIYEEKVLNTFLLRAWNNYHTFEAFGGPWRAQYIYNGAWLKDQVRPIYEKIMRKDPDRKWFSAAYNQGGLKTSYKSYMDKNGTISIEDNMPLRIFHIGCALYYKDIFNRLNAAKNQNEAYEIIKELPGFASFMAYQIFVDLTYIDEFPFSENEFTVAGPGCKNGLNALFLDFDGMTYEEALFFIRDNIDNLFNLLYISGDYKKPWKPEKLFKDRPVNDRKLNIMSLENCFCELSKYHRTIAGTGRPKQKYKGNPLTKKG